MNGGTSTIEKPTDALIAVKVENEGADTLPGEGAEDHLRGLLEDRTESFDQ